ncbi:MAG: class I SAM-dependent methyltransferase [Hyphomonadaceae bacterium]
MLKSLILRYMEEGALIVRLPDGSAITTQDALRGDPPVVIRLADWATVRRILRDPSLGLGEAYMDGGLVFESGDIYVLLDMAARNARNRARLLGPLGWARRKLLGAMRQINTRARAARNVEHHYDLSLDLYRLFLDSDLQYSCAYFTHPGATLEEAQAAKKRHIQAKLLLEPGMRVLDIGCGWGGLGLTLAGTADVDVTGLTLAHEQHALANARAARAGLADKAHFELTDYRDAVGPYDRIVSVGMFEHVGRPNYRTYFEKVAHLLNESGVALIHSIVQAHGHVTTSGFIDKYIFPGGYIPTLSEVIPAIEASGLHVTDIEILRLHYADTLRAWRTRFMARREEAKALYDEAFCRMWEFYLAGSEAAFRRGGLAVFQIQLSKQLAGVPLTRDYITDFERAQPPPAPAPDAVIPRADAGMRRS